MHPLGKVDLALFAGCFLLGAQLYALHRALIHTGQARKELRKERNARLDAEDTAELAEETANLALARVGELVHEKAPAGPDA